MPIRVLMESIGGVVSIGRHDFINLLTTQLRYQNPLEPLESREFILQLAQFTTLSELMTFNNTFNQFIQETNQARALSLLNTLVTARLPNEELISGIIKEVIYKDRVPYFRLESEKGAVIIDFNDIVSVSLI